MSWLLGRNRPQPQQDAALAGGSDDEDKNADPQLSKAERKAMEAYRFDSSALERAADAARTLERSSMLILHFI